MIKRTENNFINTYSKYRHFQSRYLVEIMNILLSWSSSEKQLCTYILRYRLPLLSYAILTPHPCAENHLAY
jgi:hypothetical protein